MPNACATPLASRCVAAAGLVLLAAVIGSAVSRLDVSAQAAVDPALLKLFKEWRTFEEPPRIDGGVPDYSAATNARRLTELRRLQERLLAIDTRRAGRSPSRSITTWCAPR